jgi:23S rRNA (cytosine1962-C5)-methyltransferase
MTSKTPSPPAAPVARITAKGASRLKTGHVWVYRSDVEGIEGLAPGALVEVHDPRGRKLGTALYSTSSQIALRMFSPAAVTAGELPSLLRQRIQAAIDYRARVVHDTDACRLVFSEADQLPGLIVDRYHDVVSFQVLTQAMDQLKDEVVAILADTLSPAGLVERVDPRIRELEQLPAAETRLIRGDKAQTVVAMNGVRFHFDAMAGPRCLLLSGRLRPPPGAQVLQRRRRGQLSARARAGRPQCCAQ